MRAPQRAPVRLTRRGKRVLTTLTATVLAVVALVAVVAVPGGTGAGPVAGRGGEVSQPGAAVRPASTRTVEVSQGDTLWAIASAVAAPGEVREVIYQIRELNGLSGSGLAEGQRLVVPVQ